MIDIKCHSCGATGAVNRVTAGLRCACGSNDVDLHDPREVTFLEFMGAAHGPGTGWTQTRPDPLDGWSQYVGPMPGPNPMPTPKGPATCPNCKGSGRSKEGKCRACFGTGHRTPTTSVQPAPQVAKHPGQTKVPFMGQRKRSARQPELYSDEALAQIREAGVVVNAAGCPICKSATTYLRPDYKGDAWWSCDACGPMANIDRNVSINPYDPPDGFTANSRSFSATPPKMSMRVKSSGVILPMLDSVTGTNPGLSMQESLGIVRATVQKYAG